MKRFPFPLPRSVSGRIALVAGLAGVGWLLLQLLKVVAIAAFVLTCRALMMVIALWLLTGILPSPWGARVRAAGWGLVKFATRFVVALFER